MKAYIAVHQKDADWMIGETVKFANHAFRTSGYDLRDIVTFAAGQNLKVLQINEKGIIEPVIK